MSTMVSSDRLLAIGTYSGIVFVLDISGNEIARFKSHAAAVTGLSLDIVGEYLASSSDDGMVAIYNLYSKETVIFSFQRPLKTVALDPFYGKKPSKQFCTGGLSETLFLSSKGWLGMSNTPIHQGEGAIRSILWKDNFIVWASDSALRLYDVENKQKFGFIPCPIHDQDMVSCSISWKSNSSLIIGWVQTIQVLDIKKRTPQEISAGLSVFAIEIKANISTDCFIYGIHQFKSSILLLSMDNVQDHRGTPEVHLLDLEGQALANDVISLPNNAAYRTSDYRLISSTEFSEDNLAYLLTPKEVVSARERNLDDKVQWLLNKQYFDKAYEFVTLLDAQDVRKPFFINSVGQQYLEHLFSQREYDKICALAKEILGQKSDLWNNWLIKFMAVNQVDSLLSCLPDHVRLNAEVIEAVLLKLLTLNPQLLLKYLEKWKSFKFNHKKILNSIESAIETASQKEYLLESSHILYTILDMKSQALRTALLLGKPYAMEYMKTNDLMGHVGQEIILLLDYEQILIDNYCQNKREQLPNDYLIALDQVKQQYPDLAETTLKIRMAKKCPGLLFIMENIHSIQMESTLKQLEKYPKYLHVFLNVLFHKDPMEATSYHTLQVLLFAEFDREFLLPFLKSSGYYSTKKAFELCEARDLVSEMVYLHQKMGNHRQAIALLLERLKDFNQALVYVSELNDHDLWDYFYGIAIHEPTALSKVFQRTTSIPIAKRLILESEPKVLMQTKDAILELLERMELQTDMYEALRQETTHHFLKQLDELQRLQETPVLKK